LVNRHTFAARATKLCLARTHVTGGIFATKIVLIQIMTKQDRAANNGYSFSAGRGGPIFGVVAAQSAVGRGARAMSFSSLFSTIIQNLPGLAVAGIGLLFGLLNWERLRGTALAISLGCAAILLAILARPLVTNVALQVFRDAFQGPQITHVYTVIGFLFNTIEAAGLGAILYAALADRAPPAPAGFEVPPKGWTPTR
jgi:hypothetical protein